MKLENKEMTLTGVTKAKNSFYATNKLSARSTEGSKMKDLRDQLPQVKVV